MATIEQRIENLFPGKKRIDNSTIAVVASFFAERRGQWLTQSDIITLINKRFADSTVRKAFKELSCPTASLDGHSFIDTELVKIKDVGGPIMRGRLSEAATKKIFTLVTPVNEKSPSLFNEQYRLELPPLKIGDTYLPPDEIIRLRNQKSGQEYTQGLLRRMKNDIPGADKEALQKVIEKMAEQQGIIFNAKDDQFKKDGRVVFPDGDLAEAHYKWKHLLHSKDEPYTRAGDVLKAHHFGPIPFHQRTLTELGMRELASDENRICCIMNILIVDSRKDIERISTITEQTLKGDEAAFDQLIQILSIDSSKYARQEAARSLGYLHSIKERALKEDNAAFNQQIQMRSKIFPRDSSKYTMQEVAHSLGNLHDTKVTESLIKSMLSDEYSGVRNIAASALGEFGYHQEFAMALKDSDRSVRIGVATILGKIKDARATEPLMESLNDSSIEVQCAACNALGEIGVSRALDSHILLLDCENASTRCAATAALGKIGGPKAVSLLRKACEDTDQLVRDRANNALKRWDSRQIKAS
jgi:hypothetical protein